MKAVNFIRPVFGNHPSENSTPLRLKELQTRPDIGEGTWALALTGEGPKHMWPFLISLSEERQGSRAWGGRDACIPESLV